MKKVLIVFGTRPEAIKMAPIVIEFLKHRNKINTKVCVTAQHREMLDQILKVFEITPDYDLDIMQPNQDLFDVSSRILLGMRDVLAAEKPDFVFVHGDTTTSTMVALASYYYQIKVCHIEAGLRTNNKLSPFPEEINRQITGRIADLHFAPTQTTKQNLLNENVLEKAIEVTGNTVIDALLFAKDKIQSNYNIKSQIIFSINECGYNFSNRKYILITGHRRENFGDGFKNICESIRTIAKKYPEIDLIYPVHLNPNVRVIVHELLSNIPNVFLIPPQDYLPFVYLMMQSFIILTDSGGIQEEAPSLGKPVLVMRDNTERPEALAAGTVKLVGTNINTIVDTVSSLIEDSNLYNIMSSSENPYGDGYASLRILDKTLNN